MGSKCGSGDVCGMVQAIAAIVQDNGQHDFTGYGLGDEIQTARLCGVTVYSENGYVVKIHAQNMELVMNSYYHRAVNDKTDTLIQNSYGHYTFVKGDLEELAGWLEQLTQFQNVCGIPATDVEPRTA